MSDSTSDDDGVMGYQVTTVTPANMHPSALAELPDFKALPGRAAADHHTAGIIMAPSLAYMDQAYLDAKAGGWSKRPIVEMLIPSTLDDSLAPPGQHVASLFCQHVAPQLSNG